MIGNNSVRDAERGEMGQEVGGVHGLTPEVGLPLLPRLTASSRKRESHKKEGEPLSVALNTYKRAFGKFMQQLN